MRINPKQISSRALETIGTVLAVVVIIFVSITLAGIIMYSNLIVQVDRLRHQQDSLRADLSTIRASRQINIIVDSTTTK